MGVGLGKEGLCMSWGATVNNKEISKKHEQLIILRGALTSVLVPRGSRPCTR